MITKQVINTIYKKYPKAPKSPDYLDFGLLFDIPQELHDVHVDLDTNKLIINSVDPMSPFHSLSLSRIHAIVPFEEWIALVLPAAIVFLNKKSSKVSIHLKPMKTNFLDSIKYKFVKDEAE